MRTIDEITINNKTLREHLDLHIKWLNNDKDGVRLDLQYANLRDADLRYADLQNAYLSRANLRGADLRGAYLQDTNLRDADLRDADLGYANLQDADLNGANLQGAKIDFTCLSLCCGSLDFKIDEKQAKQLMYHVINLMQYSDLDVNKVVKKQMFKWLEDSHLVTEHDLPILKEEKDE